MLFLLTPRKCIDVCSWTKTDKQAGRGKKRKYMKKREKERKIEIYSIELEQTLGKILFVQLLILISVGGEHKNCWVQCGSAGS